jgi:outer membrane biosynthesis protein TonB
VRIALVVFALLTGCAHTGPLSTATIDRVMRKHQRDIRACYDIGLSRIADLSGTLVLEFTIEPSGTTTAPSVRDSTLEHPDVEACLVDVATRWRFPESTARTPVSAPLAFAPEESLDALASP